MAAVRCLLGGAEAAQAAVEVVRERGLAGEVEILAYYLTEPLIASIREGAVKAAPTDAPVLQARIAVDQAVRALEGRPLLRHVGPMPVVLDAGTVDSVDLSAAVAPPGFAATSVD